jgi:hypothetical protein
MIFSLIVHHNLKIQLKYTYEECFNEKLDECIYAVNESTHSRQGGAHMSQVNIKTNMNIKSNFEGTYYISHFPHKNNQYESFFTMKFLFIYLLRFFYKVSCF